MISHLNALLKKIPNAQDHTNNLSRNFTLIVLRASLQSFAQIARAPYNFKQKVHRNTFPSISYKDPHKMD
jgi:hypothetical protein